MKRKINFNNVNVKRMKSDTDESYTEENLSESDDSFDIFNEDDTDDFITKCIIKNMINDINNSKKFILDDFINNLKNKYIKDVNKNDNKLFIIYNKVVSNIVSNLLADIFYFKLKTKKKILKYLDGQLNYIEENKGKKLIFSLKLPEKPIKKNNTNKNNLDDK